MAAARHVLDLRAIDAAWRAERRATGERPMPTLSLADRCVLERAPAAGLPVPTGDRHRATLRRRGLEVDIHDARPQASAR